MQGIFERLFNLIKKTGEKVVIVNHDSESSYVLMAFEDYEKMVFGKSQGNLTEGEPQDKIEKINQDIAVWREEEKKKEDTPPLPLEQKDEGTGGEETENQFYFEPVE